MPAAVAIPLITAGIGAGSSIFSGITGKKAAQSAQNTQAGAKQETIQNLNDRYAEATKGIDAATDTATGYTFPAVDWAQQLMSPYIRSGEQGQTQLSDLLSQPVDKFSFDPSKVADDPGYQFTLAQGIKALDQSAAARGQALSGGQLKAITGFGQGNAATYENQFFNQARSTYETNRDTLQQRVGNLFGLTGQGMKAGEYAGTIGLDQAEYASTADREAAALKARLAMEQSGLFGNAVIGAANTSAAAGLYGNTQSTNAVTNAGNSITNGLLLSQILKQSMGPTINSRGGLGTGDLPLPPPLPPPDAYYAGPGG